MTCQYTQHRPCELPPRLMLTFQTADLFTWTERTCQVHAEPRKNQVYKDGNILLEAAMIEGEHE